MSPVTAGSSEMLRIYRQPSRWAASTSPAKAAIISLRALRATFRINCTLTRLAAQIMSSWMGFPSSTPAAANGLAMAL